MRNFPKSEIPFRRGLSLVEALVSLVIVAMLLTATMVATDASFHAYANAAEQASSQAATRMVTNRLLMLLRTSTAHGPLLPDATTTPAVTLSGDLLTGPYLEMIDPSNKLVRIEYHTDAKELWMTRSNLDGSNSVSQPLMGGVTAASFMCRRRRNDLGVWILDRGTMDLTVQPGGDTTLELETAAESEPIRVIASTMPRKLQDQ
ncbi:MAG: prepilin-type N-terminal cleavage/methylation domain-containing protein [Phycisphaeraceae bacterium]